MIEEIRPRSLNDRQSVFEAWDRPFGLPPFERLRPEHFPPAFDRAMAEHNAEIAAITGSAEAPSFANTIGLSSVRTAIRPNRARAVWRLPVQ